MATLQQATLLYPRPQPRANAPSPHEHIEAHQGAPAGAVSDACGKLGSSGRMYSKWEELHAKTSTTHPERVEESSLLQRHGASDAAYAWRVRLWSASGGFGCGRRARAICSGRVLSGGPVTAYGCVARGGGEWPTFGPCPLLQRKTGRLGPLRRGTAQPACPSSAEAMRRQKARWEAGSCSSASIEGPTLSHWQRKIAFSEWAVSRGRFGELKARCCISAGGVPRFAPPEGGFINFLAKMAESVSRYRWAKTVPRRIHFALVHRLLALGDRASSLDSGARSERAVFSGGGISSGRSELARWPFFSGGGSERADFSEQNHTQNRKNFPACGPQVGPQAKF